jgi:hypothetical protein
MKFTVVWRPEAEEELAQLWVDAPDPNAVTRAANSLDAALRRDPFDVGESQNEPTRIAFVDPLAFIFDVFPDDCKVLVKTVWRNRP